MCKEFSKNYRSYIKTHGLTVLIFSNLPRASCQQKGLNGMAIYNLTLSICSLSAANSETEPNTSLNSLRYKLDSSTLEPISGSLSSKYSTRMVANRADVVGFAKKELATIQKNKPFAQIKHHLTKKKRSLVVASVKAV